MVRAKKISVRLADKIGASLKDNAITLDKPIIIPSGKTLKIDMNY